MVDSAVLEGLLLEDDDEMFDDFDEEDDEALEDLEDALESLGEDDDESYADLAERRRRRRRRVRRAPTARGRQLYRSRPAKGPVTQAQLQAALNRVRVEIRRNATGIKTLNSNVSSLTTSVNSVRAENTRQTRNIRKLTQVNTRQSKAITNLKKDLESTRQQLLLTSLLSGGTKTLEFTQAADAPFAVGSQIRVKEGG
ncbi:MAG: hypothetical protein R3A46_21860, partial [Thermomicrobiales bacterium]